MSAAAATAAPDAAGVEFFEKRIRPLLMERCYECHGEKKQKGGLRLDTRDYLLKGGDSGPALIPGKPDESLIIKAVTYTDSELQMPPKERLAEPEITALIHWVKIGAPDPRIEISPVTAKSSLSVEQAKTFWAYQPLRKAAPPSVRDANWARNDIDRFILAKLEAAGIRPAPDADRATLIRRAAYDLIGLPPSLEQMDAFANDASTDAFARLVDQWLASPHFGERWGRHWLDVVRFGESVTLRGFVFKEAWRYRDYVIDAFNRDLPYDRFIIEQIAGDLLPSANVEERRRGMIATTFLALGNTNLEEQDKGQLRMDVVDEQLDTIGKALLAQTIGCARCHDHKFDPIPTRDYYAMAGILRNTKTLVHANVSNWIELPLPLEPEFEQVHQAHEAAIAALQAQIKSAKESAVKLAAASGQPAADSAASRVVSIRDLKGVVVDDVQAKQVGEWKHSRFSGAYVGDGYLHDLDTGKGEKTLTFHPDVLKPGKYEVRLAYTPGSNRSTEVPVTIFSADGETTVHVNEQLPAPLDGRFISLGQFRFEQNGQGFVLISNEGTRGHVIADAVQFIPLEILAGSATAAAGPAGAGTSAPAAAIGADKSPTRSPGDQNATTKRAADELKRLEAELKKLVESGPARPKVMSVKEEDEIGDAQIHVRGSVHNLGATVPRGFLQVASFGQTPRVPAKESGRRELGEWMGSSSNPLTARVMANRVWHWLFGVGLVRTTDNFGTTGEAPSHPELLDYLAMRFIEEGWSVKKLVREIVLSRTYQLSSQAAQAHLDVENRLVGRTNRRRLDAECIRDTILLVSGQLKLDGGGPTIKPGTSADFGYQHHETRRSVYVPVLRNALPEIFELFDFADPSMVTGTRNASTVAPQALFLMNHPFVIEQSLHTARRLLAESEDDQQACVVRAYRWILGRPPAASELRIAMQHLGAAGALAPREEWVARWAELCQTLFASLEFRYLN